MTKHTYKRRIQAMMFKLPWMITCEEFEGFVVDYLEDNLDTARRRRFEKHLRMCRECREYLAAYKSAMQSASQGIENAVAEIPEKVPEDLVAAVVASRSDTG